MRSGQKQEPDLPRTSVDSQAEATASAKAETEVRASEGWGGGGSEPEGGDLRLWCYSEVSQGHREHICGGCSGVVWAP